MDIEFICFNFFSLCLVGCLPTCVLNCVEGEITSADPGPDEIVFIEMDGSQQFSVTTTTLRNPIWEVFSNVPYYSEYRYFDRRFTVDYIPNDDRQLTNRRTVQVEMEKAYYHSVPFVERLETTKVIGNGLMYIEINRYRIR